MENVGRRMVDIAEMVVPSVTAKETHDRRESGESIVILDVRSQMSGPRATLKVRCYYLGGVLKDGWRR